MFRILSRTQVNLASKTGAYIPIFRHGSGVQSLAVICLFGAFLQNQLRGRYGEHAAPFLALEEPEAHLHPSVIKAVGEMLQTLPGQKLISTHSGDLLAGIPLEKLRRLCRKNGKISVYRINDRSLTLDEINKINYQVRATRGSLLFSRCWLLVEGETEATLLSECAFAMGYDLYADGVSCIEFAQVGVEKFLKFANQLGIEWLVLTDKDQTGEKYKQSACKYLDFRKEANHIRLLDHGIMEVFLCKEGFGDIYENNIAENKKLTVTAEKDSLEYWQQVVNAQQKNSKPRNSIAVAQKMTSIGKTSVPKLLQDVIEQARSLARSAA